MSVRDQEMDRPTPLLSIITPVFNGERFLAGCIENFLAQRCPEAEHLIIDGGSTDRSVEIIRAHAQAHPHIRWVSERDRGQSDAMNKGLAMARGAYVSFLNADDFYEPGTLRRVVELLRSTPPAERPEFLLANCRVVDDGGRVLGASCPGPITHRDLLLGLNKTTFPVNPTAYFYARSLHDRVGPYQVDEHQHMDVEFMLRVTRVVTPRYHDEWWGNFRLYEGTKSEQGANGRKMQARWREIIDPFRDALPWPQRPVIKWLSLFYDSRYYDWWKKVRRPHIAAAKLYAKLMRRLSPRFVR